MSLDDGKKL